MLRPACRGKGVGEKSKALALPGTGLLLPGRRLPLGEASEQIQTLRTGKAWQHPPLDRRGLQVAAEEHPAQAVRRRGTSATASLKEKL